MTQGPLTLAASLFSLWLCHGSQCPVLLSGLKTRSCGSLRLGAVSARTPVTGGCWLEPLSDLVGSPHAGGQEGGTEELWCSRAGGLGARPLARLLVAGWWV